ncbi:hypothetical protein SAMN02745245_01581 [Anaerosphaera aminiphila DSM 21120]|uniref:Uncharacterized protein n=1 Tax=Anaerosphaera aminiphila DSM 21120 TaxID=1120995 RepID=A0A1M5TV03_9FIRM|nr:hypothetical protein [Anaerosphaera aminiphila]SHH54607.1 hypothetical protein SAMN02745245_01581 [Anaerosphaera aminiphila DSM 21120]
MGNTEIIEIISICVFVISLIVVGQLNIYLRKKKINFSYFVIYCIKTMFSIILNLVSILSIGELFFLKDEDNIEK